MARLAAGCVVAVHSEFISSLIAGACVMSMPCHAITITRREAAEMHYFTHLHTQLANH